MKKGTYVIVRTKNAGAFAGLFKKVVGDTVILEEARRLWYWSGAASLSELAARGVANPGECKFPIAVKIQLFGIVEIINCSKEAQTSIEEVPEWTAH